MEITEKNYKGQTIPFREDRFFLGQKPDVKKATPEISVVILAYRSGEGIHSFIESMIQSLEKMSLIGKLYLLPITSWVMMIQHHVL